jgi:hypothetical protein
MSMIDYSPRRLFPFFQLRRLAPVLEILELNKLDQLFEEMMLSLYKQGRRKIFKSGMLKLLYSFPISLVALL